ncbi:phage head closure protein [Mesorhizobium sp. M0701]|uniref:phage head closure protein n=1 Tax=Mesorhizobium sp. M0701 TaxID=2956989 RepID=UPI00333B7F0F
MTAGQLRESVTLEQRQEVDDGHGNTVSSWVPIATVAARIIFMRGNEQVLADRLAGIQPVIFTLRYSSQTGPLTTDWRLVDARTSEAFAIKSIVADERRAYLQVLCQRGVAT